MIEELATVTAVEEGYAWVQTQRQSACESCSAQKGCGTSVVGKVVGKQYTEVRALNDQGVGVGDLVKVALSEDMLLKSSLAVYLLPLLLMMAGGVLLDAYADRLFSAALQQWAAVLGSVAGLSLGVVWLKIYAARMARNVRFQPVVVQLIQSAGQQNQAIYTP